jgi:hypothetical protein
MQRHRQLQNRRCKLQKRAILGMVRAFQRRAQVLRRWCTCRPESKGCVTYNGEWGTKGSVITCNIATNVFIKSPMLAAGAQAAAPTAGSDRAASAFNSALPSRGCTRPSSAKAASHSIRMILRSGRTMRMPALKSNVSTATRLSSAEPLHTSQAREQKRAALYAQIDHCCICWAKQPQ